MERFVLVMKKCFENGGNSRNMTHNESKMRTLFQLSPMKMCRACAVVHVREKCVCVHLGGHDVSISHLKRHFCFPQELSKAQF